MIAGNESAILATVESLMHARAALQQVESSGASQFAIQGLDRGFITRGELLRLFRARVAELEQKAHDLGVYGPAAKQSARGQAMALMHSTNPRPADAH